MDFLGIGPWELLLILVVALIVIGPGKLPGIARTIGKTVRAVRKASAELTTAVSKELETTEKTEKPVTAFKESPIRKESPATPGKAPPTP
jgi:sec-independent protein translocase protein TatA